jgi:CPA2 family monovalent cation:H+ antiporter-2
MQVAKKTMPGAIVIAAADHLPPLFVLLAIMLVAVVLVSLLLLRLQQSLLGGYFICGVLIANSGVLGIMGGNETQENIQQMSEFGVMLLMFTLGLEFSLSDLKYLRRQAFGGGGLQMGICGAIGGGAAFFAGVPWAGAVLLAVAVAMSSTAVSLKSFQDLGLQSSPGARMALAVAIFQDLFIIVFFLVLPLLLPQAGAEEEGMWQRVGSLLARGGLFVILAGVCARWIIPSLLNAVTRTRNRELFTLSVIGSCVGLAFIGGLLHLGLALGAFVAGLAVSESIFKHRILADIMPIKDLFLTLFFVSVGLMIDLQVAGQYWQPILGLTVVLMIGKAVVTMLVARYMGLTLRQATLAGIGLCSAGEFSLVLLQKTSSAGLWSAGAQQTFIASAALSMGLLPVLLRSGEPLGIWLEKRWKRKTPVLPESAPLRQRMSGLTDHVIICGHGPVGERLTKSLKEKGVATLVIELNAETVRHLKKQGQAVLFADASHRETWELTRLQHARLVAFTIPDATITAEALSIVRELRPEIPVLARARFASDVERLKRLGAAVVVNDEREAGLAVVTHALKMQGS